MTDLGSSLLGLSEVRREQRGQQRTLNEGCHFPYQSLAGELSVLEGSPCWGLMTHTAKGSKLSVQPTSSWKWRSSPGYFQTMTQTSLSASQRSIFPSFCFSLFTQMQNSYIKSIFSCVLASASLVHALQTSLFSTKTQPRLLGARGIPESRVKLGHRRFITELNVFLYILHCRGSPRHPKISTAVFSCRLLHSCVDSLF